MFKHFFICALLISFAHLSLSAQSAVLQGTRLIDENGNIRVASVKILGVKDGPQGPALFYSFVHPNGGIQRVTGALMTGGRDPENLPAIGVANLGNEATPVVGSLRWAATPGIISNVNYWAEPLVNALDPSNHLLAASGTVLSNDTLRVVLRGLKPSDTLYLNYRTPQPEVPVSYAPEYAITYASLGMSGGINSVSSTTFTLRGESDRQGLLTGPYKRNSALVFDKEVYANAFEQENMSFKLNASAPCINDPVTGNAVLFGPLKYRKDDSKENSQYFEFKFVTFSKDGQMLSNINYTSEEPVVSSGEYLIHGATLAPDIREVTHVVYILRGDGEKGMEGINRKLVRALVFDLKTGQLIAQNDAVFNQSGAIVINQRQLPDGNLELIYLHKDASAQKGISVMIVGPQGIVSITDYFGESSLGEVLELKPMVLLSASLRTLQRIPLQDGSQAVLQMIARKDYNSETKTTTYLPVGHGLSIYQPDGYLKAFIPINRDIPSGENQTHLVYNSPERLVFMALEKGLNANRISLVEVNLSTYAVRLTELPSGYTMSDINNIYLNREQKMLYFLAQPTAGKGLYLFHYPL